MLPEVPTIDEAGVPGYQCANWYGLVAPAGTPEPIIARLYKELTEMTSAEFGAFIASETEKWGKVIKEAGIKAQ